MRAPSDPVAALEARLRALLARTERLRGAPAELRDALAEVRAEALALAGLAEEAARRLDAPADAAPAPAPAVLVVDDSQVNRDLLERHLARMGCRVTLAEGGLQALALLRSRRFDLVLLDILMPDVDGFQTLQQVKADRALRHVPVVMVSALDEVEAVRRCLDLGADDYLTKPFDPTLLRARVCAVLEKHRPRA